MFEMKLFNANHRFSIDIIFFVKSTASPWADARTAWGLPVIGIIDFHVIFCNCIFSRFVYIYGLETYTCMLKLLKANKFSLFTSNMQWILCELVNIFFHILAKEAAGLDSQKAHEVHKAVSQLLEHKIGI
jgi:hypothetical protein